MALSDLIVRNWSEIQEYKHEALLCRKGKGTMLVSTPMAKRMNIFRKKKYGVLTGYGENGIKVRLAGNKTSSSYHSSFWRAAQKGEIHKMRMRKYKEPSL